MKNLVIRASREAIPVPADQYQKVGKLRTFLEDKLGRPILLRSGGTLLDDRDLLATAAPASGELICEEVPFVSLCCLWRRSDVATILRGPIDAPLNYLAVFLRRRFYFPPGTVVFRVGGSGCKANKLGEIPETLSDGKGKLTFNAVGYQLLSITIVNSPVSAELHVPLASTILDIISLIQVKKNVLARKLCDITLWQRGKQVPESFQVTEVSDKAFTFECRCVTLWSYDRIGVSVVIGNRTHRFLSSPTATVAYCRTRIGKHYRLLWDEFKFAHCDDAQLRTRICDLDPAQRTFRVETATVAIHLGLTPAPAVEVPLASRICDVRKAVADKRKVAPQSIVLTVNDRPIDDEDALSFYVDVVKGIGKRAVFSVKESPTARLYFTGGRIVDADRRETFGDLARRFLTGPGAFASAVAFEADGEVLGPRTPADRWVHPLEPLSVVYLGPLTVVDGDDMAFVDVKRDLTVAGLDDALGRAERPRAFVCGSRVLARDGLVLERNPTLLPVFVRPRPKDGWFLFRWDGGTFTAPGPGLSDAMPTVLRETRATDATHASVAGADGKTCIARDSLDRDVEYEVTVNRSMT
jgi:hypothetical protein